MSQADERRCDGSEVAVVGMAGRFPGARDLDEFWRNLAAGVDSVTQFSEEELKAAGEDPKLLTNPNYVRVRPVLADVERFDAAFFGFSPREAEILDPQLRLFLECAYTAFGHAGYDPQRLTGRASLFAGAGFSNYLVHNLYKNRPVMDAFGDMQATIMNVQDALVTMAGYKLNLKGACCAVQTFCSTSLVAVHLAAQNLLGYESDFALAGGVSIYVPQTSGYLYEEGSIVSRRGRCRVFDAGADGTVFGNGVGVVLLRRLEDALRDGDTVHAVILGSAVNNDGSVKVSYAAPGLIGQTEVVVEALSAAGVDAGTIDYVEAHGTGTRLGDPAEVGALIRAFRTHNRSRGFCALGSVKTNVGHLDAAAGVAGLIKLVLSLQHGQMPPILHFETPNPDIDFADSPFFVNDTLRDWKREEHPRRAGVSAFGVGGTNAHVIVEEAPPATSTPSGRRHQLLVLSAKTSGALDAAAERLGAHLEAHPGLELADVAHTLQVGRGSFSFRAIAVCANSTEAARVLGRAAALPRAVAERREPPVVLWLQGQSVVTGAWRELFEEEPAFQEALTGFLESAGEAGRSVQTALYPSGGANRSPAPEVLPPLATVAVEYALARTWQSWGVRFEAVGGQGLGRFAAACVRGVLDFATAARRAAETAAASPDADELPPLAPDPQRLRLVLGAASIELRAASDPVFDASRHFAMTRARALDVLGRLWLAGVEPDWAGLHAPENRRRVPLPTYPFERERYWVNPLPDAPAKAPDRDPGAWLYRPVWKRGLVGNARSQSGRVLVFLDEGGVGRRLAEGLRAQGTEVVTASIGRDFAGDPLSGYTLDPTGRDDYRSLFADLEKRQQSPGTVVHLWSLDPLDAAESANERFRQASDRGFHSLLHLASTRPERPLSLVVVSSGLHEVVGGEILEPEKAPLLALCRVLGQEQHDLTASSVEIDGSESLESRVEAVLAEMPLSREPVVAWRRGRRWIQSFESVPAAALVGSTPRVRERGVYLITGGLGDVGYVLGAALAHGTRARLVLTGRRGLPPREAWSAWLQVHDPLEETALRIRKVQALEAAGAEVLVLKADASSREEMQGAVAAARKRFGAVQGVVHAAGELSPDTFRPVRELDRRTCERQFAPKVQGLVSLADALGEEPLDFFVLTSSLSGVLGGVGYAAYAGANAFMDAFAVARRRKITNLVSVAWDQWEFAGRAVSGAARQAAREGSTLRPEEGIAVFEKVLRLRDEERIVVSTTPLAERLERWVRLQPPSGQGGDVPMATSRSRPGLATAYVAPRTEVEKRLAYLWQELLGIDEVGVNDDFFELGGHSLFAARLLSRVRVAFELTLPLEAVFDAPTVAEFAKRVHAAEWARRPAPSGEPTSERIEIEI